MLTFFFFLSLAANAGEFALEFFSNRILPQHQAPFQQFFGEIEQELPELFRDNIHKAIRIEFTTFNYNKIGLSCQHRNYENYARLSKRYATIEVNEQLMFPILNQHMDRDEHDCTYREVLIEAINRALWGHLNPDFYTIDNPSESAKL